MLCKPCGKDHTFKGKFVEWSAGVVTIRVWSPCTPNDVFGWKFDADRVPVDEWLNADEFDIDLDLCLSVEAAKA